MGLGIRSGVADLKLVAASQVGAAPQAAPAAPKPADGPKSSKGKGAPPPKQPTGWGDIEIGAIVLAAASPKYQDWYECVVIAVEGDDRYTLRYCDWPDEPAFVRRRVQLGLMHPAHKPEPPLEPDPSVKAA